jgi:hypothetical protein
MGSTRLSHHVEVITLREGGQDSGVRKEERKAYHILNDYLIVPLTLLLNNI